MRFARQHLTYANTMATIAVFIALSGGAYAAVKLPAKSVGARELKNGAVTKAKIDRTTLRALAGARGAAGAVGPAGVSGASGAVGAAGATGPVGAQGADGATGPAGAQGGIGGTLPSGATLRGIYRADASTSPAQQTNVSFGYRLSTIVTEEIVTPNGTSTAHCKGTPADPTAAPGYVCFYATLGTTVGSNVLAYDPETMLSGQTGHTGMVVYTSNGAYSQGTWAVTAP
ncbi:MAG TPA: hypothetical protein VGM33_26015 [Baekduia sp.]|jgi:hypothetical protein